MAKTMHCWRDRHKDVYSECVQAFGVVEADKYTKKAATADQRTQRNIEGSEARV